MSKSFRCNPAEFDGAKFKARYSLTNDDFWAEGNQIHLREGINLPDNPPIFEASTAQVSKRDRIEAAQTLVELKEVLKEVL